MNLDTTLHIMGQYDFKKPIRTTIIFEDNNEEGYDSQGILNLENYQIEKTTGLNRLNSCISKQRELLSLPIIDLDEAPQVVNMNAKTYCLRGTNLPPHTSNNQDYNQDVRVTNCTRHNLNYLQYVDESRNLQSNDINNTILFNDKSTENKMIDYFKTLQRTVAENLVTILKAYRCYKLFSNNHNSTKNNVEFARKYFLTIREHYIKLSFVTLTTYFLPEQNNFSFMNNFFQVTLDIARFKGLHVTVEELKMVYSDMIQWCEAHNQRATIMNNIVRNKIPSQQSRIKLSDPKTASRCKSKLRTPASHKDDLHTIFVEGPVGSEIQINVEGSVLQSLPNASANLNSNDQYNCSSSKRRCVERTFNNNNHLSTHLNESDISSISVQDNLYSRNYNDTTASVLHPSLLIEQDYHQRHPDQIIQTIQISDVRTELPSQGYPLERRCKSASDQSNIRSSISRDSGFTSPSNFNTTADLPYNSYAEQSNNISLIQSQRESLLANITAVSPSGSLIEFSLCHVCGQYTNTVCTLCHETYYCSRLCLNYDASKHRHICLNLDTP